MRPKRCLDPDCFVRSEQELRATNSMELLLELKELIDCCLLHGACYFIIDANEVHRYVQGLIQHDGTFTIESVSNESLGEPCTSEHPITAAHEAQLLKLGWQPPCEPEHEPNWYRPIDWEFHYPSPLIAEILVRTLFDVHGATMDELVVTVGHALVPPSRTPVDAGGS